MYLTTRQDADWPQGASGLVSLDDAPLKPVHLLAAAAVLDGYVLGIVGPSLALAGRELNLSAVSHGLIAASALIGVFIGGLFFGSLADRYGRRPVLSWNLAALVLLSILWAPETKRKTLR